MSDKKIKIFSKKMNTSLEVALDGGVSSANILMSWANQTSWINNGWSNNVWANTFSWSNGWNNAKTGWNNTGRSWNNADSGCFITTACVEHMGYTDDCDDLATIRCFRDKTVEEDEKFREIVLDYYKKAPAIVERINADPDKDQILDNLYKEMISPCVSLIKSKKTEEAKKLYYSYYLKLADRYL